MNLEKSRLIRITQSLHDHLLEMQLGPQPSTEALRNRLAADFADPGFQRGYLMGMERVLRCDGIPAYLSGTEAQIITSHINRIGMVFTIQEKEQRA